MAAGVAEPQLCYGLLGAGGRRRLPEPMQAPQLQVEVELAVLLAELGMMGEEERLATGGWHTVEQLAAAAPATLLASGLGAERAERLLQRAAQEVQARVARAQGVRRLEELPAVAVRIALPDLEPQRARLQAVADILDRLATATQQGDTLGCPSDRSITDAAELGSVARSQSCRPVQRPTAPSLPSAAASQPRPAPSPSRVSLWPQPRAAEHVPAAPPPPSPAPQPSPPQPSPLPPPPSAAPAPAPLAPSWSSVPAGQWGAWSSVPAGQWGVPAGQWGAPPPQQPPPHAGPASQLRQPQQPQQAAQSPQPVPPAAQQFSYIRLQQSAGGAQRVRELAASGWQVTVSPTDRPDTWCQWMEPWSDWAAPPAGLSLSPAMQRTLLDLGFDRPTECQQVVLPLLMSCGERDVVLQGPTGSGKTVAFLLPVADALVRGGFTGRSAEGGRRPVLLVLVPTKELAAQTASEAQKLLRGTGWSVAALTSAFSTLAKQQRQLQAGVDIVVGTVGRVFHMVCDSHLLLDGCQMLVVDEVDRFFQNLQRPEEEQDFRRKFHFLMERLPACRRTVACSATVDRKVQNLLGSDYGGEQGRRAIVRPGSFHVSGCGRLQCVAPISQYVYKADTQADKFVCLRQILDRMPGGSKAVVFMQTADPAALEGVAREVRAALPAATVGVHSGNLSGAQRAAAVGQFAAGGQQTSVLVSSAGTLGRGIDLDINVVIVFEAPRNIDEYTHMIGRTGRAGRHGVAFLFYSIQDYQRLPPQLLARYLRQSAQEVPSFLQQELQEAQPARQ
eukprot:TRINITY_DN13391_c0_g1_i3.p1 TRINITY_DN13391_c0_g1~~TRINITY_DN13391_c0_g1_i3.p1  ORF type:complete len:787 (+),score=225.74 TRINITY_DN13391_c0_g1_i3:69-2429(+)